MISAIKILFFCSLTVFTQQGLTTDLVDGSKTNFSTTIETTTEDGFTSPKTTLKTDGIVSFSSTTPKINLTTEAVSTTPKITSSSTEVLKTTEAVSTTPKITSSSSEVPTTPKINLTKESTTLKIISSSSEVPTTPKINLTKEDVPTTPKITSSSIEVLKTTEAVSTTPKITSSSTEVPTTPKINLTSESTTPKITSSEVSTTPKITSSSTEVPTTPKINLTSETISTTPKIISSSIEVLKTTEAVSTTPKINLTTEPMSTTLKEEEDITTTSKDIFFLSEDVEENFNTSETTLSSITEKDNITFNFTNEPLESEESTTVQPTSTKTLSDILDTFEKINKIIKKIRIRSNHFRKKIAEIKNVLRHLHSDVGLSNFVKGENIFKEVSVELISKEKIGSNILLCYNVMKSVKSFNDSIINIKVFSQIFDKEEFCLIYFSSKISGNILYNYKFQIPLRLIPFYKICEDGRLKIFCED